MLGLVLPGGAQRFGMYAQLKVLMPEYSPCISQAWPGKCGNNRGKIRGCLSIALVADLFRTLSSDREPVDAAYL